MEIQDEIKASFIISLIGNTKAGKTCLIKRYVEN
jgi:GTPase SAR1 family protein